MILEGLLALSLLANAAGGAIALRVIRKRGGWTFVRSWLVARGVLRDEAKERFGKAYTSNKLEQYERLGTRPGDILFIGDSLTEGGLWHELLDDPRCKNRGIGGDTSQAVLARLRGHVEGHPAQVFVLVGVNDLLRGVPVDQVLANYATILETLAHWSPETRVVVQSCLPIDPVVLGEGDNAVVRSLNEQLQALAIARGVEWLDLYPRFERDGRLSSAYTHDGLHLNGDGYLVWRDALRDRLVPRP